MIGIITANSLGTVVVTFRDRERLEFGGPEELGPLYVVGQAVDVQFGADRSFTLRLITRPEGEKP